MKYRGQVYEKKQIALDTTVESEVGKYRGVNIRFKDVKAVIPHPAARLKYRGVDF